MESNTKGKIRVPDSRFKYNNKSSNERLAKKREEISRLSQTLLDDKRYGIKKCFQTFLQYFFATLVVILAILYAWFANYPLPPLSPILHQWKTMGKTFDYHGHSIFYFDSNPNMNDSNAQTLLYLHGFPTSTHDLFKLLRSLTKRFDRVIAPDFIGFGFSDKPNPYQYSINDQANLVEKLMKHLDFKNAHILSHDYGDTVAQELLARQQDGLFSHTFRTVCMMNGGIFPSRHRPILMQDLLRWPIIGSIITRLSNRVLFAQSFAQVFGPYTKPSQEEFYDAWTLIRFNNGYLVMSQLLSYIDERFENEHRWVGAISQSPAPLHFIYGDADPVNPPPFEQYYRKIIYKPSIDVLKDIGHYPQLEAPTQVIQSYFRFLELHNVAKSANIDDESGALKF